MIMDFSIPLSLNPIKPVYWQFLREDNGDIPSAQEYEATPVAASL